MRPFQPLQRLTLKIPIVTNPFEGVISEGLVIPHKLILFTRTRRKDLSDQPHSDYHHRFVLILNLKTAGAVSVDQHVLELLPAEALLIFPYQFHFYPHLESEVLNWLFMTFETDTPELLECLKNRTVKVPTECWPLIEGLVRATQRKGFKFKSVDNRMILLGAQLLHQLTEQARENKFLPRSVVYSSEASAFLGSVSHLAFNAGRETVGDIVTLARRLHLSESHLRAKFRRQTGLSLGAYLRKMRISRACGLLSEGRLNVTQTAAACGFDSLYSFSRTFKKETGVSPLSYRKKQAGQSSR